MPPSAAYASGGDSLSKDLSVLLRQPSCRHLSCARLSSHEEHRPRRPAAGADLVMEGVVRAYNLAEPLLG